MFRKLLLMVAAAGMTLASATQADAATTLAVGTLAPKGSPWMSKFQDFSDKVKNDTGSDIILDFRTYSDEQTMYGDIEKGVLAGGAMTAVGLSKIYQDVLIFQLPGIFSSWGKLDKARDGMKGDLDNAFNAKGYTILGWGDVGAAKIMTDGKEVRVPGDLAGLGSYVLIGDQIGPAFWSKLGNAPTQVTVPEIFTKLNSVINVVVAPPLVAEQFQWASKLKTITGMTAGFGIGALVFKTSAVPQDKMQTIKDRGKDAASALTGSIRGADGQAFSRLKSRKTFVELKDDEKKQWHDKFAEIRSGLRGTTFTAGVYDKVQNLGK
jgi:TRAP-type C4-dicarboxylate transport system substrate-binding protein